MLDLATVLLLAGSCAPDTAPQTLAAIVHVESRFDPLAIGVNRGARPPRRARTAAEASAIARALIARGGNLDLGLAQINSANLDWLGLSVEDAFDPCRNLAAASTVLHAGYRPAGDAPAARQSALRVALSRYNTGDARRGFRNGYVARVEAAAARLSGAPAPLALPSASASAPPLLPDAAATPAIKPETPTPPPAPPAWDVFARRSDTRLVFPARNPGSHP